MNPEFHNRRANSTTSLGAMPGSRERTPTMATKSKSLTTEEAANRELTKQAEAERKHFDEERETERAQDQAAPDQQVASILTEPPVPPDNPKNPRGVQSNLTDGTPNAQATNAQKVQDPVPSRPPLAATSTVSVLERVSAGQNRKPPAEVVP